MAAINGAPKRPALDGDSLYAGKGPLCVLPCGSVRLLREFFGRRLVRWEIASPDEARHKLDLKGGAKRRVF